MRAHSAGALKRIWHSPWQVRLVVLAAIWGMSFLFIKVGDESLPPLQVALGRMIFGTAALLVVAGSQRERLPRDVRTWAHLAVAALLLNALPFSLFAYGETRTTSVVASICNATAPLFTLPFGMLVLRGIRPTRERAIGLAIGFAGVLVVLGVWQGLGGYALPGNLACLGAAMSYGLGFPYAQKYLTGRSESVLALATVQLVCGTAELAIVTPFVTRAPTTVPVKVIASIVVLGALGTGIAHVLNYSLIRDAGATIASTVTYLIPLFSTLAGFLILGEPLTWYEPVGALVVVFGVALTQGRLRTLSFRRVRSSVKETAA